ncbi:MAG: FG-GAP-like repeat-containing protein [Planctomycetota bacterium]
MRSFSISVLLATAVAFVCAPSLRAQWATFQDQTSTRLSVASGLGAADPQEKDYAWADFDQDGDTDMVIARKSPFTSGGHFPNVLLMNEGGVLTDRTATLGSASTVAGSSGMLDATNDRDVVAVDVNGDGWLDLVTCTTLTAGQPQYIRVPRVYINRGNTLGVWQGFLYDDALRINDMQAGASWNGEHRFCSVAAGDIDGDGDQDLYFGDYQQGGSRSLDVNDRLLLNNGAGYFTDVSAARMTTVMLESSFAMKVAMVDMNMDGRVDILKDDALNAPQAISISYNNPANPGFFNGYQLAYGNAPYHFHIGDLNNDNLPDMIVSDDGQDRYILHQGVVGGQATFGPEIGFTYTGGAGGDDGFGGNNIIADLNNDGWKDVIIADVDVDISGCGRRCHIFRNLGNAPNVTLQEQQSGTSPNFSVCGIPTSMLVGTFDVAVFDINGDGWKDMVIGRCNGTTVWMNTPPIGMSFAYPNGLPVYIQPGSTHTLNVTATGIGGVVPQAASGRLYYSINNAPFQSVVMSHLGGGQFQGTLPAMPNCSDKMRFYVTVDGQGAVTFKDPPTAPTAIYNATAAVALNTIYENNFEIASTGWSVVNTTLTAGAWERVTPIGTTAGAQFAAPPDDAEASLSATKCYTTQNGVAGGSASAADVDGGPTDLISPPLNFAGTDGFISYRRWFYCSTTEDNLTVSVSNDGVNWVTVETVVSPNQNQWIQRQFQVSNYVVPNATIRVRFRTSDNPNNSNTEAGLDVFKAEAFSCTACQQAIALATNGTGVMSICGGNPATPGAILNLAVLSMPGSTNGFLVFDLVLAPTPWLGGTLMSPAPTILGPVFADANGNFLAPLPIGGLLPPGWFLHTQSVYVDVGLPNGVGQTNAVKVQW